MTQIATNKEQSERLVRLGVPVETADMYLHSEVVALYRTLDEGHSHEYIECKEFVDNILVNKTKPKDAIPAWSLVKLLSMLQDPRLQCDFTTWTCSTNVDSSQRVIIKQGDTPFEAVCNVIEAVHRYGFKLNIF